MVDAALDPIALRVLDACRTRSWRIATAESCTGGLVAGALTAVPGASDVLEAGIVSYANDAKSVLLGVDPFLIDQFGAVSRQVAAAMAEGMLARLSAIQAAVSTTGIAGPGGGSAEKPVGLVHFAVAVRGRPTLLHHEVFPGTRADIRVAAVARALLLLLQATGT